MKVDGIDKTVYEEQLWEHCSNISFEPTILCGLF